MVPTHDELRATRSTLTLSPVEEALVVLARRARDAEQRGAEEVEEARDRAAELASRLTTSYAAHEITKRQVTELRGQLAGLKDNIGDLQASEAELVAAPLRARIAELEANSAARQELIRSLTEERDEARRIWAISQRDLAKRVEHERVLLGQIKRLEADVARLESQLLKGHVCTPACRENSHVAFVGRERVTELEAALLFYQGALDTIRTVVATPDTTAALTFVTERITAGTYLRHLAMVVREVSDTLVKAEGGPPAQG